MISRVFIYAAAAFIAAALIYIAGLTAGGDGELARTSQAAIEASQAQAASTARSYRGYRLAIEQEQAKNQALVLALAKARAERRVVYRNIRQEVPHAIEKDRQALAARGAVSGADGAGCRLGAEFVGVWDAALDPARAALPPAAGVTAGDTATALPAARVDAETLLANHVDNAELAADVRAQLEALIRWHLDGDDAP